jgi:hypothetical protein
MPGGVPLLPHTISWRCSYLTKQKDKLSCLPSDMLRHVPLASTLYSPHIYTTFLLFSRTPCALDIYKLDQGTNQVASYFV